MSVALLSTYELGRQPFGLASPAAWLREAGAEVNVQDLAVSPFDPRPVRDALFIGIYVPMHTATRLAEAVLTRVRQTNPRAHVCVYGLYAPMNADHLRALGADSIVGGEFEHALVTLYRQVISAGGQQHGRLQAHRPVTLERQHFRVPDRTGLPDLKHYARLQVDDTRSRIVGYTEASRGCKHFCRHCPIVPVYNGRFFVVQAASVLEDVRRQVAAGAQHITFGDPDFFNGPRHSIKIVRALHHEFPALTYDVTVKVQHLREQADLVPVLKDSGCVLVTSAVESMSDHVLKKFAKQHTHEDVEQVVRLFRQVDLALNPTFVAFTPWTSVHDYAHFLRELLRLALVDNISPVQYSIRLLIPAGSLLLELDDVRGLIGEYDPKALAYPWTHPDWRMDRLHTDVTEIVRRAHKLGASRREVFRQVWRATCDQAEGALEPGEPDLAQLPTRATIPYLTEPWYC